MLVNFILWNVVHLRRPENNNRVFYNLGNCIHKFLLRYR